MVCVQFLADIVKHGSNIQSTLSLSTGKSEKCGLVKGMWFRTHETCSNQILVGERKSTGRSRDDSRAPCERLDGVCMGHADAQEKSAEF